MFGDEESSVVSEIISKSTLCRTISKLIWPIISLLESFNFKFFNTVFSLLASFEVFVFRMVLFEIDAQFFVVNN